MSKKLLPIAALALFAWPAAFAYADHELGHDAVARGGLVALEQRVTDLENAPDADTLGGLSCDGGQIAKFDGAAWACAADEVGTDNDTLGDLSCDDGEIARFDDATSQWICAAPSGGTSLLRTIVIGPQGPTALDNCDELRAVLDGIADSGPDNQYLIKLEPGVYDCGPNSVVMKPFVDIAGSGVNVTRITGNPNTFANSMIFGGVIVGADNAELRHLTAEHGGGTDFATVIDNQGSAMRISDVDVTVSSPANNFTLGIVAVDSFLPGPILRNVRVIISGPNAFASVGVVAGVRFASIGGADLENVTASGGDGLVGNVAGRVLVRDSVLAGINAASTTGSIIGIVSTQLGGPVGIRGGGAFRCIAAYDRDFFPLDETCAAAAPLTAAATSDNVFDVTTQ